MRSTDPAQADGEAERKPDSLRQRLHRALARRIGSHPSEEVVRSAFQAVLGRPPEAEALRAASAHLASSPQALQVWLQGLLRSPESARRNAATLIAGMSPLADLAGDILPLGTHCYTAQLLGDLGLRRWSGPFDWIFSSVPMVTHCLDDDFRTFLDRSQFEPVPEDRRLGANISRCDHRHYRDRFGVHHVFNHHDAHLDEGYAYFVRCVERLRARLASPRPKTLLLCTHDRPQSLAQMQALRNALGRRCEHFRLVAICVTPQASNLWAQLRPLHEDDTLHVHGLTPSSAWEPLHFADPADDLCVVRALAHSVLR